MHTLTRSFDLQLAAHEPLTCTQLVHFIRFLVYYYENAQQVFRVVPSIIGRPSLCIQCIIQSFHFFLRCRRLHRRHRRRSRFFTSLTASFINIYGLPFVPSPLSYVPDVLQFMRHTPKKYEMKWRKKLSIVKCNYARWDGIVATDDRISDAPVEYSLFCSIWLKMHTKDQMKSGQLVKLLEKRRMNFCVDCGVDETNLLFYANEMKMNSNRSLDDDDDVDSVLILCFAIRSTEANHFWKNISIFSVFFLLLFSFHSSDLRVFVHLSGTFKDGANVLVALVRLASPCTKAQRIEFSYFNQTVTHLVWQRRKEITPLASSRKNKLFYFNSTITSDAREREISRFSFFSSRCIARAIGIGIAFAIHHKIEIRFCVCSGCRGCRSVNWCFVVSRYFW